MEEDPKITEGQDGSEVREGQEVLVPYPQTSQEVVASEVEQPAPANEEPSAEAISSPPTPSFPSTPPEPIAPQTKLNPADGGSWRRLSEEVGEETP